MAGVQVPIPPRPLQQRFATIVESIEQQKARMRSHLEELDTLYASLQQMDLAKLNVSTVEDPVEYRLGGITQIQVHERINLNFSTTLRSLLRQIFIKLLIP